MAAHAPTPTNITLHSASRVLEIQFDDGQVFKLPFEFLRVYSPSAEVRGHGPGQETLQPGKRDVTITDLQPIGHYAVQPLFSDGRRQRNLFLGVSARDRNPSVALVERVPGAPRGGRSEPRSECWPENAAFAAPSGFDLRGH